MAYGTKYTSTFDSGRGQSYTLNIKEKDYSGGVTSMVMARDAVILKWNTDEMKPGIKGREMVMNIVNTGPLPITSFFSVEDDTYLAELLHGADQVFTGYLVQDGFAEIMIAANHAIQLKATDNLGLLKDIPLGGAAITFGSSSGFSGLTTEQTSANTVKVLGLMTLSNRMVITIDAGNGIDGQYGVLTWQYLGGTHTEIHFETELNGTAPPGTFPADFTLIVPVDLSVRMYLSQIFDLCFKASGIQLPIAVYSSLYPTGAADDRLFDNVLIDPQSFLKGERWDSCYAIMESILSRFYFTLFQSEGRWNILRWDELRLFSGAIPCNLYDADFVFDTTETLDNEFIAGIGEETRAEVGLLSSPERPFKFVKEKMIYENPANLIKNINFEEVGRLLSITAVGPNTQFDYEMTGWEQGFEWTTGGNGYIGSSAERIIRVIKDTNAQEIDRFGVIKGIPGFDQYACAQSNPVEVVPGDVIKLSFDFKTNISQAGPGNVYFRVNIITTANPVPRNANNKYLNSLGRWNSQPPPAGQTLLISVAIPNGDNTNQWHTVTVESDPIPVTGVLNVKLAQATETNNATNETYYKNIRFEVLRSIGGSKKVIGHLHTDSQLPVIKNTDEREIKVDNTPSNIIAGTLFLHTFTGPVRNRVTTWEYNSITYQNLGQVSTLGQLYWHRVTRLKLEGTFYVIVQNSKLISMLSTVIYNFYSDKRFNFGMLELRLRTDTCNFTLFENYEDGEVDSDLKEYYNFRYLFEK